MGGVSERPAIELRDGPARWLAGAGALGFDGFDGGHPPLVRAWKLFFRARGHLDPRAFDAVITKTVTALPRRGNQTDWTFWRCARPLRPLAARSLVNAVALTNPGFEAWRRTYYRRAMDAGVRLVLSLHLEDAAEAAEVGRRVTRHCGGLAGVEINAFCPNAPPGAAALPPAAQLAHFRGILDAFQGACRLPTLVKYAASQPWPLFVRAFDDGRLAGNELVNACPLAALGRLPGTVPAGPSPLARYGYDGSASGGLIWGLARDALGRYVEELEIKTPVASGGGVIGHARGRVNLFDLTAAGWDYLSLEDVVLDRVHLGAHAVVFSTALLWWPPGPGALVARLRRRGLRWPGVTAAGKDRRAAPRAAPRAAAREVCA